MPDGVRPESVKERPILVWLIELLEILAVNVGVFVSGVRKG